MSLLSTLEEISDLQSEAEEKDEGKQSQEVVKLPRTNSLEDLDIKVFQSELLLETRALIKTEWSS